MPLQPAADHSNQERNARRLDESIALLPRIEQREFPVLDGQGR